MEAEQDKKKDTGRRIKVQSHCSWSEMGKDYIVTYVFIERRVPSRGTEMVYYTHIQAREDDCVSSTAPDVSRIRWS